MQLVTYASFLFFTGLVAVLTWWLTRKDRHDTSDGYFLGGRSLTAGYIAGSLLLTNLSAEQLVGLNGDAYKDGLCVMAWEVVSGVSLVLMALFFLPRYLSKGIATVPELLERRFDEGTRTITTIIFIVAYCVILFPIILYAGAVGLINMLDLGKLTGIEDRFLLIQIVVWMTGLIGACYAIIGGLRTVAVSDTLNGFGLLAGGLMIVWFGLQEVPGDGIVESLSSLKKAHPGKFNSIGGHGQSVPFSTLFSGVFLLTLFYWCTNQQIIQRTFGASSLKEGQKGVLLACFFKILAPIIVVLPGIIAYHLYHTQNVDSKDAYGILVQRVLPTPLVGFFAAALLGAILSSFNSALNSTATLFSLGVYKQLIHKTATEQQVIRSGKVVGWAIAIASMCIAPLLEGQESIFKYLQKMNGIYFMPILAVVVVGMVTRHVPALGAKLALIVGPAVITLGYFEPHLAQALDESINGFHFLGIVFAGLIVMMLLIGSVKPRKVIEEEKLEPVIDMTPWKFAKPVGLLLVLFIVAIYAFFADFSIFNLPLPQQVSLLN